jgi:hypothetical protein
MVTSDKCASSDKATEITDVSLKAEAKGCPTQRMQDNGITIIGIQITIGTTMT